MTIQSIGAKALSSIVFFAVLVLPARADVLVDPISLLASDYRYFGSVGFNPSSETDFDISDQTSSAEATVDRASSFNVGLNYNFSETFGYYWSLTFDSDSKFQSGGSEADLEGFTNSLGIYSMLGLSSSFPLAGWAEVTLVNLESKDTDATFESTEIAGGLLAQVFNTEQLTLSAGAEFIVSSEGNIKNPGSTNLDTERVDSFGGKAIATYKLSDKILLSAQGSFANKSAIAVSAIIGL